MDVSAGSAQRFALGIERFLEGDTLACDRVVFWKDPKGKLLVFSYSDFHEPANFTPSEAREKIERSKGILANLCAKSSAFAAVASQLPHRYEFCDDYGMGSVTLAWEESGEFTWRGL
jgi:hypothetical protein